MNIMEPQNLYCQSQPCEMGRKKKHKWNECLNKFSDDRATFSLICHNYVSEQSKSYFHLCSLHARSATGTHMHVWQLPWAVEWGIQVAHGSLTRKSDIALEWYCSQDVPTWSKSCACGRELSAELIVFSCSLKVVTSFFLALIEVLQLCTASSP